MAFRRAAVQEVVVVGKKMRRRSSAAVTLVTRSAAAPELVRAVLPCEIRVVDEERREIEICATSEAIDAHGTIFDYDASKRAFDRWAGNVREMHERKAVGRKVAVRYDDDARKVYVRMRISAGAQDTWEKVKDGTLAGASIGASNVTWRNQRRAGAEVPVAIQYDLIELSLVDLPSNPDASGPTFIRAISVEDDAADATFDTLDASETVAPASTTAAAPAAQLPTIREGAGALTTDDPAAEIARRALAQGTRDLEEAEKLRGGHDAAAHMASGPTANELRLARLGAPGYVARSLDASDVAPGASFDVDGDHDGSGQGDGLEHAADIHAHIAHDHAHTGDWQDAHLHGGLHQHLDGTSHTHDHAHDHSHHDHASAERNADRVQAGHTHGHVHGHDHGHYYRVADGMPTDERLVTGEQVRTREYVSATAFRMAGGVEGRGLSADQYRIAAGVELRLELAAADERAQGAFSRNPLGPADIGTPAEAAAAPTEAHMAASATGAVRPLDRDGQPTEPETDSSTGTLDVSGAADGYAELTRRAAEASTSALTASFTAAVSAEIARAVDAFTSSVATIEQRLARIESQPMPGGPVFRSSDFRAADKSTPLTPSQGQVSVAQQIETLQGLAGRIADPQAQVAVAAEMIRLQQEAAGMPPAMQVMPRAGRGWGE